MIRESIVGLLICVLGSVCGNESDAEHRSSLNETYTRAIKGLEIPDSELLLFSKAKYQRWRLKSGRQDELSHPPKPKPCACEEGVCACCSGIILGIFGQKACVRVKYSPEDFNFDVSMTLNGDVLYENAVSGNDPAPMCVSPPRIRDLKVCAKFSNVFFPGRNFHFCTSMIGQWRSAELFRISFDCLRMGANGIAMVKPEDAGGIPIAHPGGGVDAIVDSGDEDIEEYDENLVRSLFDIFER